mmetsp:Transcript_20956/g.54117  ORF Transcript_20956/g.54117 Transcript_20956/m.54117 type:complete len:91 (+) Transcript_20956:1-273(+)
MCTCITQTVVSSVPQKETSGTGMDIAVYIERGEGSIEVAKIDEHKREQSSKNPKLGRGRGLDASTHRLSLSDSTSAYKRDIALVFSCVGG